MEKIRSTGAFVPGRHTVLDTRMVVNEVQQKKASEGLQSFMQDVNGVQRCLDEVINQRGEMLGGDHWDTAEGAARVISAVAAVYSVAKRRLYIYPVYIQTFVKPLLNITYFVRIFQVLQLPREGVWRTTPWTHPHPQTPNTHKYPVCSCFSVVVELHTLTFIQVIQGFCNMATFKPSIYHLHTFQCFNPSAKRMKQTIRVLTGKGLVGHWGLSEGSSGPLRPQWRV